MQYILTQEEYDELLARKRHHIELKTAKLQELCTKIADEMPVKWGWGGPDPKPWGCILSADCGWYCDQCPVQEICPCDTKDWSQ
jgi:hypothetical protein